MGNKLLNKTIHYCWFGGNALPPLAIKCIDSWKSFFPDYKIREWNESNFDVNAILYTKQAYEATKYAFVSDYARFYILYNEGGIYFDTDVEVIKPFDDIIESGPFMGCEKDISNNEKIAIAPGLGIGVNPGLVIYKDIIDYYKTLKFKFDDGTYNLKTIVEYTTEILKKHGLKSISGIQQISGINIYPKEYFCPKDIETQQLQITSNTHSIHHYDGSWVEEYEKKAAIRCVKLKKIFGKRIGLLINEIIYSIQKNGFIKAIKNFIVHRLKKI